MRTQSFKPGTRYLTKLRLVITLVALLILISGVLISWLVSTDPGIGIDGARTVAIVVAIADVVWYLPALIVTRPYYRSLSYEIQDDEVIVRVGIWTKSVKHVPYRTVTNLTVNRGILDRWLGLGTLNIQTAGMSGSTGAEESLVGLTNVEEVYEIVATELRRFRGGMAPTAAGVEGEPAVVSTDALNAILTQVRAIRKVLETG
ncbi:MAG: PH domain-containing protein [Chloroflexota bacterium]|nr:PH domain-containing protein [Chloroflexota bacterium]